VRVVDYGIRACTWRYDLLDGYDLLVLLDAAPRGASPATSSCWKSARTTSARRLRRPRHGTDSVLASLGSLGGRLRARWSWAANRRTAEGIGLSPAVARPWTARPPVARLLTDDADQAADHAKDHTGNRRTGGRHENRRLHRDRAGRGRGARLVVVVLSSANDIRRYLRIRRM